jgi:hypothetical protein
MEHIRSSRGRARRRVERPASRQCGEDSLAMLRPISLGMSDLDVETMHVFPGDGVNIVVGLTTATGTANLLLSPRLAGEVADALRWLLDEV